MTFLKKWLGQIVSFVLGVCGLALSACSGMIVNAQIDASAVNDLLSQNQTEVVKGFEVITDSSLYGQAKELGIATEFVFLKVFAFITLIVSILLIVHSVVLLLKNLNVIKVEHKAFNIITVSLVCAMLVATIGLLVCSCVYANAVEVAQAQALKNLYATAVFPAYSIPAQAIDLIKFNVVAKVGVYQPLMLALSGVSAIAVLVTTFIKREKA